MYDKLKIVEQRYNELTEEIGKPEVIADQNTWRKLMKEHASMEEIVNKYKEYKQVKADIDSAKEMLNESGIVLTNVTCSLEGKNSDFIKYEYATYKKVFDEVKLYAVQTDDVYVIQNLILVGIKGNPEINTFQYLYPKICI